MRKARRVALIVMAAASAMAAASCSQINPDINRVEVTPYETKADFNDGDSWYYSTTVVKGAPNGYLYEGDGGFIVMERLKWEITETQLIGWRDYSAAPGTEINALEGGEDTFKGQPIAVFAISEHFDVRRGYDPLTGEQNNQIIENTERPWHEREYMRVNWSRNEVPSMNFHFQLAQMSTSWAVQPNEIGDPKRWRFERDDTGDLNYIEVTNRTAFSPNFWAMVGLYGAGHVFDTAPVVSDIRHSFMKVPESDYIPLAFPESVVRVDENGEEMRDDDGFALRAKVFDRFGYFTTWSRQVWDPNRGFTKPGEQDYAIRYNVWQNNRDEMGNPIPFADREPKPMIWYTNQNHPKQLLPAAQRVASEWNKVFKEMVFEARNLSAEELGRGPVYDSLDDVPDMFVLRENDCNPANVQAYLDGQDQRLRDLVKEASKDYNFDGRLEDVIERYNWANSYDNRDPIGERQTLETSAMYDLARICTAIEHYTRNNAYPTLRMESEYEFTGEPFQWQRVGDIRYNMINGIVEKALAPWLGVATILADPTTGEEIKGTANIGIAAVDLSAYRANEAIKALNGEIDLDDILYGYDVSSYMRDKLYRSRLLQSYKPSQQASNRMSARFAEMGEGTEGMREMSPEYPQARLDRLTGTHIEDLLVSDENLLAYGTVDPITLEEFDGDIEAAAYELASPLRNWENQAPRTERARLDALGEMGIDPIEFVDQFALGAAMEYRDITDDRLRFEAIREDLYVSTQLHEVGHTIGLRHNFEASSDALNYGRDFWEIQALDEDLNNALGQVDADSPWRETILACIDFENQLRTQENDPTIELTTQFCLAQNQAMYSTIMEYNGHWTHDFGGCDSGCGLGLYDYQAIKFGYAQLLQQFNRPAQNRTEKEAQDWLFFNDWRDIPGQLVQDIDAIEDRSYFFYDWNQHSTNQVLPENTVPYRFCTDGYSTPTCNRWDWGPDNRYQMAYNEYVYYQRYFFTHFNRDRFWTIWGSGGWRGAMGADARTMAGYSDKMKWYFYYNTLNPEGWEGSYAQEDFLASTMQGLNFFSNVLSHPGSGNYAEVPVAYMEHQLGNDPLSYTTDEERLAPSGIAIPFNNLGQCEANYLTTLDQTTNQPTAGQNGFNLGFVKLGDGRPFAIGSERTESEEWVINYVGTYFAKQDAFAYLAFPGAWFPKTDILGSDVRNFNISWYRLFPEEVGGLIHKFVTEQYADLGPLIDPAGNYVQRDLIDLETGEAPDYTGYTRIIPTVAFNHQYFSAVYALAWMSSAYDGRYDMSKSFIIAVDDAEDDHGLFATLQAGDPENKLVQFTHPITGRTILAVDEGPNPIGADLVRRLNVLAQRYDVLDRCVKSATGDLPDTDPDYLDVANTPYCKSTESIRAQTNLQGTQLFCTEMYLETPGEGISAIYELENRRDRAREIMNDMQDFIDDVRIIRTQMD